MPIAEFPQFGPLADEAYANLRVREVARSIRRGCGQLKAIPFDPEGCAEFFGIAVKDAFLPQGMSGRISMDGDGYVIERQARDYQQRRRFTLAHELGHLCFISRSPVLPLERGSKERVLTVHAREEILCDRIAAELLMPMRQFGSEARNLRPSLHALEALAERFDVSVTAALTRIQYLRIWSVARATWISDSQLSGNPKSMVRVKKSIRQAGDRRMLSRRLGSTLQEAISFIENIVETRTVSYQSISIAGFEVILHRHFNGKAAIFVLA